MATGGSDPALEAALKTLGRFHPKIIDLSLGRIEERLAALGHPERQMPPVFHVAGTNGKGSTVAFLRAILGAAGYGAHVYTSPHLVRFNERIRIAGKLIGDDELIRLIAEVERAGGERPITEFEIITAIAFLAFSRVPADASLIEVGLGGRYDATNVFPKPHVTAVTRISIDHRDFFGDDIADIAGEKAGVFKKGVAAIVAEQPSEAARNVLVREAKSVGAELLMHGEAWRVTPTAAGFRYESAARTLDLPKPGLAGAHQIMNAGTAIAMIDAGGGFKVSDEAIAKGLGTVEWPGRLQRLTKGVLRQLVPAETELWLDGAHNDSGGEVLGAQAAAWRDRPLDVVLGMRMGKEPRELLRPMAPYVARLRTVAIPGDPVSLPAEDAAAAAREAGINDVAPAHSVSEAVLSLLDRNQPARILICGSLYLAGAILAENG